MGYAIAGLYVFIAAGLAQLFVVTEKLGRLDGKIDNLATEMKKISGILEWRDGLPIGNGF